MVITSLISFSFFIHDVLLHGNGLRLRCRIFYSCNHLRNMIKQEVTRRTSQLLPFHLLYDTGTELLNSRELL